VIKRIVALSIALILLFLAWPLWSGWQLRQAMRARDVATLEARVDWPTLRTNLKPRIATAIEQDADQSGKIGGMLKRALGGIVADKGVDYLVTPKTLARVLAGREFITARSKRDPAAPPQSDKQPAPKVDPSLADPEDPDDPIPPRRLRWAFFDSPTRFRIEATHPRIPNGRIVAILGQQGFSWKLVDVQLLETK
jgi:Protein of unknown function (DUF2939)